MIIKELGYIVSTWVCHLNTLLSPWFVIVATYIHKELLHLKKSVKCFQTLIMFFSCHCEKDMHCGSCEWQVELFLTLCSAWIRIQQYSNLFLFVYFLQPHWSLTLLSCGTAGWDVISEKTSKNKQHRNLQLHQCHASSIWNPKCMPLNYRFAFT